MAKKSKTVRDSTPAAIIIFFTLAALLLYILITMPNVKYEDLMETDAVVDNFHVHYHSRTADSAHLVTEDGTEYLVSGDYYPEKTTKAKLVEGTHVEIKYYDNHTLLAGLVHCAQEVKVGNKIIVSYENDAIPSTIIISIFIILFTSAGVFLLWFYIKQIVTKKQQ